MAARYGALRWVLIDEVEAAGAETTGQLEHNVTRNMSLKSPYRYNSRGHVRPFGGANVCFLGDFWQLRPTGQVALMSNPFAKQVSENPRAQEIMGMFWHNMSEMSLQVWTAKERILM